MNSTSYLDLNPLKNYLFNLAIVIFSSVNLISLISLQSPSILNPVKIYLLLLLVMLLYQCLSWLFYRSSRLLIELSSTSLQKSMNFEQLFQVGSLFCRMFYFLLDWLIQGSFIWNFYYFLAIYDFLKVDLSWEKCSNLPSPNSSMRKQIPYLRLFENDPSNLHPLLQQSVPKPYLLPTFHYPLQIDFIFLISFLFQYQKQLPRPEGKSFFHSPQYFSHEFNQFIVPLPYFLSATQFPQYSLPEGYLILPNPDLKPSLNSPSQRDPFEKVSTPFPYFNPLFHLPLYADLSVEQQYYPNPCLLPSYMNPTQQLPFGHVSLPSPVTQFPLNQPSQTSPSFHLYIPLPSISPFLKFP